MNFRIMGRTIGPILLLEALLMLPSVGIALWDGDMKVVLSFLAAAAIAAAAGVGLGAYGKDSRRAMGAQDGFVIVALCWVIMSLLGALPFWFSREIPHFVNAVFETVSGFTTTGASILTDVEAMSRGLLYWRSFTHWLGGMGMLVFALAVVPSNKKAGGTLYLMRAESPGPDVGKLVPRTHKTAMILYGIYILMTILCCVFLLAGGMSLFDSVCTAFGTAGTGGFGIKNDSMAGYSPYLQTVVTVFMLLFGVNFNIYYLLLLRHFKEAAFDEELRTYLLIFFGAACLITWNITHLVGSLGEAFHHAAFTVSSIMTTTGFATLDFNVWPGFSKAIILCLMVLGASAGSTGGGIKTSRLILMVKHLKCNIRQTLRPRSIQVVHLNGHPVDQQVLQGISSYMAAYWILIGISLILVSLDEFPLETNISAVFSCFNNIGPGFQLVGPAGNYSRLSDLSKVILTMDMLLGRLEIFPILALLDRNNWNPRRSYRK